MQKKLIALAIAGLASSAAFAQSNVTAYGRVDYGFVSKSGDLGSTATSPARESSQAFQSGVQSASRLGFKGSEDLGNGLKAIFETEFGLGIDQPAAGSTNATFTNRHSFVGLTGGFGTVVGGRLDGVRYGIFNKYDAFTGGTVAGFTNLTGQVDRADNAIAYISPNLSGFTILAAYSTNIAGAEANTTAAPGNHGDSRLNTLELNYANGPISLDVDYETVKTAKPLAGAADDKTTVFTVAGSYDFGVAKVVALYDSHKVHSNKFAADSTDYRDYFVGVRAPLTGALTLKAQYGKFDNRLNNTGSGITGAGDSTANDANKFGIGLDYALSKRTVIYTDYGRINNSGAAAFEIGTSPNAAGNGGTKGFDLGIAHNF